jgi:hypothetical protein
VASNLGPALIGCGLQPDECEFCRVLPSGLDVECRLCGCQMSHNALILALGRNVRSKYLCLAKQQSTQPAPTATNTFQPHPFAPPPLPGAPDECELVLDHNVAYTLRCRQCAMTEDTRTFKGPKKCSAKAVMGRAALPPVRYHFGPTGCELICTNLLGIMKCRVCGDNHTEAYIKTVWNSPGPSAGKMTCKGKVPQPGVVSTTLGSKVNVAQQLLQNGFLTGPWDLADPLPPKANTRPTCLECDREICSFLDAYYGDNLVLKAMCSKCRRKYE